MKDVVYAGFWIRTIATIIDSVLLFIIIIPWLLLIYGFDYLEGDKFVHGFWDIFFNYIFPAIVVVIFWFFKSATPGKMIFKLKIVDANNGETPSKGQFIGRYFGYYLSFIPLFLGFIWVGFDKRKQGWHDKLANTIVVQNISKDQTVTFKS